jgi:hypothetical protein
MLEGSGSVRTNNDGYNIGCRTWSNHKAPPRVVSYEQCCGSSQLFTIRIRVQHSRSMRIRVQHSRSMRIRIQLARSIRIRIQGWWTKFTNFTDGKKLAMKEGQSREETPQRTSSNSKHEIFTFLFLWGFLSSWARIRMQPPKINADPCESGSKTLFMRYGC